MNDVAKAPPLTARQARKLVEAWIRDWPNGTLVVKAKNIDFTDLARCHRVFVTVAVPRGTTTPEQVGALNSRAASAGFSLYFIWL